MSRFKAVLKEFWKRETRYTLWFGSICFTVLAIVMFSEIIYETIYHPEVNPGALFGFITSVIPAGFGWWLIFLR
jgi:quinol-cytochrome oxidoreductase complex cytochrome b subunit